MLQRGIEEARESALRAKQDAKGGTTLHPTLSTHSPSHTTHHPSNSTTRISSKFDSVLRSPSLLQVQGPISPRETQPEKKTSRIPVRQSSSIREPTAKRPSNKLRSKEPTQRNEVSGPNRRNLTRGTQKGANIPPPVQVRAPSPPVPALAKRINTHIDHGENNHTVGNYSSMHSDLLSHDQTQQEQLPPRSPPVPALAKKIKTNDHTSQQSAPIKAHRALSPSTMVQHIHVDPASQPCAPARDHSRALSPPVPSLAKKLSQINVQRKQSPALPELQTNASLINISTQRNSKYTDALIPINRVPSCELVHDGLSPSPTMQTVGMDQRTVVGPNRQQVILQQLAALKEVSACGWLSLNLAHMYSTCNVYYYCYTHTHTGDPLSSICN